MGWWKAFIPQHLSNAALLNILDICTHFKISQRKGNANRRANAEAFAEISTEVSAEGFSYQRLISMLSSSTTVTGGTGTAAIPWERRTPLYGKR